MIDVASDAVVQTIDLPAGSRPREIAITPDGKKAYVTDEGTYSVTPIDLPSGTVEPAIVVGSGSGEDPHGLAITPDGKKVFVAVPGGESQYLAVIDTATEQWVDSIEADNPDYVAIGCNGTRFDAQLEITKDDGRSFSEPGADTYTIVVRNTGSADATGVRVVDDPIHDFVPTDSPNLPPGVQFDLATLMWTIGALPAGGSVTLQIHGTLANRFIAKNLATVTADNAPAATAVDLNLNGPPEG